MPYMIVRPGEAVNIIEPRIEFSSCDTGTRAWLTGICLMLECRGFYG